MRAHTLLVCRQRFQHFLVERDGAGRIVYERFTTTQRRKIMSEMRQLQDSVAWHFPPNLYKIRSWIGSGDPLVEKILQFADFFAYAPHIKLVTKGEKKRRFEEIKHKYYNFNGTLQERGFVVYRLRRFLGLSRHDTRSLSHRRNRGYSTVDSYLNIRLIGGGTHSTPLSFQVGYL